MKPSFTLNALCSAMLMAGAFSAHAGDRVWVPLDDSRKAGTAAEIVIDQKNSNSDRTVFELKIAGFWMEDKKGPDGRLYQKIDVPGLGSHNEIGAPDLPAYRFNLAVANQAKSASLQAKLSDVETFQGLLPWPEIHPETDFGQAIHRPSEKERFVRNEKIYEGAASWPADAGVREYRVGTELRSIPALNGEIWPVSWDAKTRQLQVAAKARYQIDHKGEKREFAPISQERYQLAGAKYLNWDFAGELILPNFKFYTASYLFIYPDDTYADEIKPLADQKRTRGFQVTEMTADDIGDSCDDFRDAIEDWADAKPVYHDLYALLVGDTDVIPLCDSPTNVPTDDLYASTNGDDLDEEIYLGRLSIDDEADLANQVNKILTYEDQPNIFFNYGRAVLWAHEENAPGKYEGAHETVRTNGYSNPPTFSTIYGSDAAADDDDVIDAVNQGVGLLAYRGHGSETQTAWRWNQTNQHFDGADVSNLANALAMSPVVWSFACSNSALDWDDAIAEDWMELTDTGSVSYYGATVPSGTTQNHELDEAMFLAVYDEGLVTQSHAIEWAEDRMADNVGSANAWMYLLLGDPDMQIRTERIFDIHVIIPDLINVCKTAPCHIEVKVVDDYGRPIPHAFVGLWKPAIDKRGNHYDDVFTNGYADQNGKLRLAVSPSSAGELYFSAEDGRGNAVYDSVTVK